MDRRDIKIYFIPGLGLDERVISNVIKEGLDIETLNWITPLPSESVKSYALRLSESIDTTKEVILIGHSFGGIMAQEISQIMALKKIFLISTVKSREENTLMLKALAPLKIYKLITKQIIKKSFPFWGKSYGYTVKEEGELFLNMIGDRSNQYLLWAIEAVSKWHRDFEVNVPVIHIHGDQDKTFPIRNIKDVRHVIQGGTHFMVYNRAKEIAKVIRENLESVE